MFIIMRGRDGNTLRRSVRILQIAVLTFFVILTLVSIWNDPVYVPSSQNVLYSHYDNEGLTKPIKIVITSNSYVKKKKYDFTIVTGASENHFCPIKAFAYNLKNTLKDLNARVIVYDLGLTDIQQEEMKKLRNGGYFDELRVLNFSDYPSFWNISENRGEYAWKPGIIKTISKEYPGVVVWLDAGTLVERKYFEELPRMLKKYNGFLSPRSSGFMNTWTHPGVYDYYDDNASKYDRFRNCNGASIAFDTRRTQHIINEWYLCALDKDCIAPTGSNRTNHRQDQAILTYLAARENRRCNLTKPNLWLYTHEDDNCEKIITFHEEAKKYY